ncbi:MAG: hypothetical protein DRJ03_18925 [Chloroflexi bacterium]|nr:MAG: hypothetical protein DRI81_10175 [Chloroflexota bacterium]RLC82497.1 MAG: hypothetical protein DRJ03_18925 [Chloroflexota bacterium]
MLNRLSSAFVRLRERAAPIEPRWRPVVLLLAVQLLGGMSLSPQRAFMPVYLGERLGYTAVAVSLYIAAGRVMGVVSSVFGGMLSDVLGRKRTLVLGILGFAFSSLAFLVPVPWLAVSLWAVSDLAAGFYTLGGQSYLIDAAGPERLGMFSAFYYWGLTVGGVLSNPIAGVILDNQGFGLFGAALLILSLATALGTMVFLPRLRGGRSEETASWKRLLSTYRDIVRRPMVAALALLRFLPTCYWGMATVLIPLLINRMTGAKTAVALYAVLSQVMASLAQLMIGRAADRWGPRIPTLMALGVLVVSAAGLAGFSAHLWSFYTFGVLAACAAWSLSALMPRLVIETTAPDERGRVLGVVHTFWNVGMVVGSLAGGMLVELAVGLPFFASAVLNLATILLAISFFRSAGKGKRSSLLEVE